MQPSSLIFLVIVAIWVAYLIQHWVRRREHLATARSVDKFSEAMRVLERRSPLPESKPVTSAAAVGVAGSGARPAVVVKRATVSSPLRARDGGPLPPVHSVPPMELVPHRTVAQTLLRRVRGMAALLTLLAVPVTVLLSTLHVLKWVSVAIAVAVLVAVVAWLRVSAIREQAARRARRAQARELEANGGSAVPVQVLARARRSTGASGGQDSTGIPAAKAGVSEPRLAPRHTGSSTSAVLGVTAVANGARAATSVPADGAAAQGEWQPVPVPPPTYSLKETAHRPEVAATPPGTSPDPGRPVPIEVEDDDLEVMVAPHRRRVVG